VNATVPAARAGAPAWPLAAGPVARSPIDQRESIPSSPKKILSVQAIDVGGRDLRLGEVVIATAPGEGLPNL
jgi:hypothetical protein